MLKKVIVALWPAIACLPGANALAQATSADLSDIVVFACEDEPDPIILQRLLGNQFMLVEGGREFGGPIQGGREVSDGVFLMNLPDAVVRIENEMLTYADSENLFSVACKRIDTVYLNALDDVLSQAWVSGFTSKAYPMGSNAGALAHEAERANRRVEELELSLALSNLERADAEEPIRDRLANALVARALAENELADVVAELDEVRAQLNILQGLIDERRSRDIEAQARTERLDSELNAALARAAAEERRRRELEDKLE